jgi:spermidine synthase
MNEAILEDLDKNSPVRHYKSGIIPLVFVFVVSTCGLVFELICGTVASYLLGDSVTQFSTVIGVYLFAMGMGSLLSKYIDKNLAEVFVRVEIMIGLVGGFSAATLFTLFNYVSSFGALLYSMVGVIGVLVGVEIPLLMRLIKTRETDFEMRNLIANVFTFDYVGALLASLLFPLVLVPYLGLVRSSLMFGALNVAVAFIAIKTFRDELPARKYLLGAALATVVALGAGFVFAERIMSIAEARNYPDPVIFAKQTKYQRIVITERHHDIRLYLNGILQFSSRDEYRYHESLVHVGLEGIHEPKTVLVLGGGDGLALREILKYPSVESVTLVDLDADLTQIFSVNERLLQLNGGSLLSPRVRVITEDAFVWLRNNKAKFDFIVQDFPDPGNFSLGKLYSTAFFRLLADTLTERGMAVVQSTSPLSSRKTFWCVDATLRASGFLTTPYHVNVPAFGEWGFVLASKYPYEPPTNFIHGLKFVDEKTVRAMLEFSPDMARIETGVNRLNNQALVQYYEEELAYYLR